MGPPRHLGLIPPSDAEHIPWPVPFADGIEVLRGLKGRRVAVLVSGDPFWFGAGSAISTAFPGQWRALPGVSIFARVAAQMGWALQDVPCLGLHAAPLARTRPHLSPGARLIVTLRDGAAVSALADYLRDVGFGDTTLTICEAMGGPRETVTRASVAEALKGGFDHPVAVAIEVAGNGAVLPRTSGLPDALFQTDGVMTKRALRAITLSALAPRAGEHLWDIGGGSGSIAAEWMLAHPACTATTIEPRADRCALIRANADALGVDRMTVIKGHAPEVLPTLPAPDAVFVGGGLNDALRAALWEVIPAGTRVVANAVTLETEALLVAAQAHLGGDLTRIELSTSAPMGSKRGWKAAYPVIQWSVTR